MKFFLPDWEDRIDPRYDFVEDKVSRNGAEWRKVDLYAHEVFEKPPYDGVLVSLALFEKKLEESHVGNIRAYMRVPKSLVVMGDCGAFSYVKEEVPPEDYKVEKVCDTYQRLGFDLGVSVDHIILDSFDEKTKEFRREITLRNSKDFILYHAKKGYRFEPVGAVQGYSVESYEESAVKTAEMGYRVIGIGSLVRKKDEEIVAIAERISKRLRGVHIHLFGVQRFGILEKLKRIGIGSFDSTSALRRSWLDKSKNYLGTDGKWYSAIRIPPSDKIKLMKVALEKGYTEKQVKALEKEALQSLREYASGNLGLEETLRVVLEYDSLFERKFKNESRYRQYRETLEKRPWERCNCEICKAIGVEVIIFRGSNRNRRRGFHNVKVFYEKFL